MKRKVNFEKLGEATRANTVIAKAAPVPAVATLISTLMPSVLPTVLTVAVAVSVVGLVCKVFTDSKLSSSLSKDD